MSVHASRRPDRGGARRWHPSCIAESGAVAKGGGGADERDRVSRLAADRRAGRTSGRAPPVEADAGRVEQVLTNLLVNAHKYGEPGTPIVVELEGDVTEARVTVVNRGRGIDADDLPHVFERFYRARGSAERRIKGLGLGLFIVRGIVEAHGGRVFADSTPGERTRFGFSLPRAPGQRPR